MIRETGFIHECPFIGEKPRKLDSTSLLPLCQFSCVDWDKYTYKRTIFLEEITKNAPTAMLSLVAQVVERSFLTAPMIAVGRLSTTAFAGASLGAITASVTGLSILQGFVSALDTLLPHAWKSPRPELVGLCSQRMWIAMNIMLLPIFLIWYNSEKILVALGQEPEVAKLAEVYLRYLSFGLPAYGLNLITRHYFQAQGLFSVQTRIVCSVAPINLLMNYLLVWGPESIQLGFIGAPISSSISYALVSIISLVYATFSVPRTAWHPLSRHAFTNLGSIMRLGLAGIGQIAPEWWAWEYLPSIAGLNGVNLASNSVIITIVSTLYQLPSGLSNAASMRVGNLLGEGRGRRAAVAANASITLALIISSITSIVLLILRHSWATIFTVIGDPEVIEYVTAVIPIIALYQIVEGIASVAAALLRCKGSQLTGAILSIISYFAIALPLGSYLTTHWPFGLRGIWASLIACLFCSSAVTVYLCLMTNWNRQVEKIKSKWASENLRRRYWGKS